MTATFAYLGAACGASLALVAMARAGRSAVRWSFAGGMALFAAEQACNIVSLTSSSPDVIRSWQSGRLIAEAFFPSLWVLFSMRYARNGGGASPATIRTALWCMLLPAIVALTFRDQLVVFAPLAPSSQEWTLRLGWSGSLVSASVLIASIAVLLNLERTFRASVGTIRWRIKFMILGVSVLFVTRVYTSSQALLFRGVDPALEVLNSVALIAATPLLLKSFFRAGHFDTQVYPSQAVLRSSLTVLLAGIYLLVLAAFARIAVHFGGDTAFALKALVVLISLVLLAVLLQSDRLRLRMRRFVSRHFRRPMHDYRAVWSKFTDATASRVEAVDLSRSLVTLIADTFDTLSVTLWLVDDRSETVSLAASTARTAARTTATPTAHEARKVIAHLQKLRQPVPIETADSAWAQALRRWHPVEFANGGGRVCVPVVARGRILGLLILGDRINGIPFSDDDLDMLECVAAHAAASLLNVRLSRELVQAKELEAFQSMAAFFVHDLKNAASTLRLMLQNLPVHFDDPAFRDDALRGLGNTAAHIDRMIRRLTMVRHELNVELSDTDLNQVVASAIAGLDKPAGAVLEKDMHPVPVIPLDAEQLKKVVVNLVLNAAESIQRDGHIRVSTRQENGWVVLKVEDNGCGMTEEFLAHGLFRPFQTTKKNGLGIGMFQSKMIVEAHGGRIAVTSAPGRGTTFEVFLRAPTPITPRRRSKDIEAPLTA